MAQDKAPLLGELEALQAVLLDTAGIDPATIPLLDDIIESAPPQPHGIQSEETRFSDAGVEYTTSPSSQLMDVTHQQSDDDFARELFIQDLIDSMMPGIESELRKRLLNLDQEILERWYHQAQANR
ncbi:hypothetical protein [Zhongshania sp.]|uniref:hypothetical protein n=1 Tax=Zhongshania sp. TaxID=1971902 RepID=UPI00356888C4